MGHNIISLGRQFGSGGREIGQKLASELGVPYYDRELISMAAKRAELQEAVFEGKEEKAASRWLFTGVYAGGPKVRRGRPAEDILFEMQSQVILELARKEDCIIVGRCADYVLQSAGLPVLSLFVCAPFQWRVRRRMELEKLDERAAAKLVEKMDRRRGEYYHYYTKREWGIPESYDLCVNSATFGIDRTAHLLAVHYRELISRR